MYVGICPSQLTLTADDPKDPDTGFEGAGSVRLPPRDREKTRRQSGTELPTGTPGPSRRPSGKDPPGARTLSCRVPDGIPRAETRLPILFSEGPHQRREARAAAIDQPAAALRIRPPARARSPSARMPMSPLRPLRRREPLPRTIPHHGTDHAPCVEVTARPVVTIPPARVSVPGARIRGRDRATIPPTPCRKHGARRGGARHGRPPSAITHRPRARAGSAMAQRRGNICARSAPRAPATFRPSAVPRTSRLRWRTARARGTGSSASWKRFSRRWTATAAPARFRSTDRERRAGGCRSLWGPWRRRCACSGAKV